MTIYYVTCNACGVSGLCNVNNECKECGSVDIETSEIKDDGDSSLPDSTDYWSDTDIGTYTEPE